MIIKKIVYAFIKACHAPLINSLIKDRKRKINFMNLIAPHELKPLEEKLEYLRASEPMRFCLEVNSLCRTAEGLAAAQGAWPNGQLYTSNFSYQFLFIQQQWDYHRVLVEKFLDSYHQIKDDIKDRVHFTLDQIHSPTPKEKRKLKERVHQIFLSNHFGGKLVLSKDKTGKVTYNGPFTTFAAFAYIQQLLGIYISKDIKQNLEIARTEYESNLTWDVDDTGTARVKKYYDDLIEKAPQEVRKSITELVNR